MILCVCMSMIFVCNMVGHSTLVPQSGDLHPSRLLWQVSGQEGETSQAFTQPQPCAVPLRPQALCQPRGSIAPKAKVQVRCSGWSLDPHPWMCAS